MTAAPGPQQQPDKMCRWCGSSSATNADHVVSERKCCPDCDHRPAAPSAQTDEVPACSTCHAIDVPLQPAVSFRWEVIPGMWSCVDAEACLERGMANAFAAGDALRAARATQPVRDTEEGRR